MAKATFQNDRNNEQEKMNEIILAEGILHELPDDLKKLLKSAAEITEKWNKLTPIQRNEWICWVTIVKKSETREEHIQRMLEDLAEGKR